MRRVGRIIVNHLKSNVIGYIALVFALGGTAGAVTMAAQANSLPTEAWHVVGTSGQPAYIVTSCGTGVACDWAGPYSRVAKYYADPYGTVHVRLGACWESRLIAQPVGSGHCTTDSSGVGPVFRLPAGYRPGNNLSFASADSSQSCQIDVGTGGSVSIAHCDFSALDTMEVTFKADA